MSNVLLLAARRKARERTAQISIAFIRRCTSRALSEESQREQGTAAEASLPLLQRCKNHLLANWRGQLSTVKADDSGIHGSLVQYAVIAGQAFVWIPKNDIHEVNLYMDDRGSFVVGHTDPPPLIGAMRKAGHVPPRTILLADFSPVADHQMEYLSRRLHKILSSTKQAMENAGPATKSLLSDSGGSLKSKLEALEQLVQIESCNSSVYRLNPKTCQYVDLLGGRHLVEVNDLMGSVTDHLCPLLPGIIEGVNQNDFRRAALVMFCAVYVQQRVQDAYLFSADRWGINVLAKILSRAEDDAGEVEVPPPSELESPKWREYRFSFSHEVKNIEQFCLMLAEMEKECIDALAKAHELLRDQQSTS